MPRDNDPVTGPPAPARLPGPVDLSGTTHFAIGAGVLAVGIVAMAALSFVTESVTTPSALAPPTAATPSTGG